MCKEPKKDIPEVIKERKPVSIVIVGARGLREADEWFPDSRLHWSCAASIYGRDGMLYKTKQVRDTPAPLWREEFTVSEYEVGDTLEFSIWESDADGKREDVGRAFLEAFKFDPNGFNGEVELEQGKEGSAYLKVKVKMVGDRYPPNPEDKKEFPVTLSNPGKSQLGLDFDLQDGFSVFVTGLKAGGLIRSYNRDARPAVAINPGDFIVKVNEEIGNSNKLLEVLKSEADLRLLVRRPEEFAVPIVVPGFDPEHEDVRGPSREEGVKCGCGPSVTAEAKKPAYGLEFTKATVGRALVVAKVLEGGPVEEWNMNYPDNEVKTGDRIIAVDGQKGRAEELLRRLKTSERFHMTIIRPADLEGDEAGGGFQPEDQDRLFREG